MRFTLLLLAVWYCRSSAASCNGLGGVWHDSATDDVMKLVENSCLFTGKYGTVRMDPAARKVTPEGGLLEALGVVGKWHPFDEAIKWSNGVLWRRKQVAAAVPEPTPVGNTPTPATPTPATPTPASNTPAPSTGSVDELRAKLEEQQTKLEEQQKLIDALEALVTQLDDKIKTVNTSRTGPSGRDGYCLTTPNVTEIYVPKKQYVHHRYGTPLCTGDSYGYVYDNASCHWSYHMAKMISVYTGDEAVFWRPPNTLIDLWEFPNQAAYAACDFSGATLRASLSDFTAVEATRNFSITFTKPGDYYFGAKTPYAADAVALRQFCWDPDETPTGAVAGQPLGWGYGGKTIIRVIDPTKEQMVTCPLWDPSKYGKTGGQVDSESVEKLKGSVAAIGRHLIQNEERTAQRVRAEGQSGIAITRSMSHSLDAYFEPSFGTIGAGSIHNHANTAHTIGLGEFAAVLNGVQFSTRHNDYSLLKPDEALSPSGYKATWPPQTVPLDTPPVPPSVTAAGNVDAQVAEMKEYFRAFHTQNASHRPYTEYFKPVLCYLEGTWTEADEAVAEPFTSERHKLDADSWSDLNEKLNFMMNNGQKHILENLAFLPSTIRGMRTDGANTFEPEEVQWFYRIVCQPLDDDVPTKRFRVRNDLQMQMRMYGPATRAQLAKTNYALYEVNPLLKKDWTPSSPWIKGQTQFEYIDELMAKVPGFDGPQANLMDKSFGATCKTFDGSSDLDTSKYSRYFSIHSRKDASGMTVKKRGFNDYLFAAQTTHPRVSPKSTCAALADRTDSSDPVDLKRETECSSIKNELECRAKRWEANEVSDADYARCSWLSLGQGCGYKKCWTQRWSYAIPLEVVYLTPLLKWNPYNIKYYEKGTPGYDAVSSAANNGQTAGTPYKGSRQDVFFRIPAQFYGSLTNPDPADTSGGEMHVEDASGTVRLTRPSGTWVLTPPIEGLGQVRTRYPIFPLHEHGNTAWKEVKALAELMMGKDANKDLRDIVEETREGEYGMELKLSGGGHEHYVQMDPNDLQRAESGAQTDFFKFSTEANGHQHYVFVQYKPVTKTWSLGWCTQGADLTKPCPYATVVSGSCSTTPVNCCPAQCPDGHNALAPSV